MGIVISAEILDALNNIIVEGFAAERDHFESWAEEQGFIEEGDELCFEQTEELARKPELQAHVFADLVKVSDWLDTLPLKRTIIVGGIVDE
jgi:hypothetical protein